MIPDEWMKNESLGEILNDLPWLRIDPHVRYELYCLNNWLFFFKAKKKSLKNISNDGN